MMDYDILPWISTTGGPLVVLQESDLKVWEGIPPSTPIGYPYIPQDTNAAPNHSDLACAVREYADILDVQGRQVLVQGGDYLPATWYNNDDGLGSPGLIVRWGAAESGQDIILALADTTDDIWRSSVLSITFGTPLRMFDAVYSGTDFDESLVIPIVPGEYEIRTGEIRTDDLHVILHKFVRS